ncbi:MAG: monovalent cation/H+ antiporter complex subunit F [Acidobacteriota bacterium]
MITVTLVAVLVCMALLVARAISGTSVFERVLAINSFGTKTVLLIALHGFLTGRPDFLDLALVYALMNFVGTIAVLRFTSYGQLVAFGSRRTDGTEPMPPARPTGDATG